MSRAIIIIFVKKFLSSIGKLFVTMLLIHAEKFTEKLPSLSEECIPTKNVTIRLRALPWMNNTIRKLMRKRNRV